ncbi:DUF3600 domain-containing protein [Bacillus sp. RG28]|uniref:DUF3600 domain-containing protein n=1 Tax=Gottfriedia endophytica TaxID=2820819 RepID=A0A940NMV6_9BACI|nr:DUF3600 domain-containing protein [Gottfriedia endophytica]MBP0723712.1 DUF3600 domain-containing protein [Gottfriedia endophytica]
MDINTRLRESIKEKGNQLIPSTELKVKVISNLNNPRNGKPKNKLIKVVIFAALLIPTSAFSYQAYLADGLYGSFENLKKHIASATMDSYFLLNAKLMQAKGDLGESGYKEFKKELSIVTNAKLNYGDKYGNIDYDKLPLEKARELENVYLKIQPYFDKLNGLPSSKDVLTSQEYREYIKSLMTYEKIMVQSGINPKKLDTKDIPPYLQEEYQKALNFMRYVDKKQEQE